MINIRTFPLLFFAMLFSNCSHPDSDGIHTVEAIEFKKIMESSSDRVIIDVRSASEFNDGNIAGALNIDVNDNSFEDKISHIDTSKTILVYCLKGGRSATAAEYMQHHGFRKIYNLHGGIRKWKERNFPVQVVD